MTSDDVSSTFDVFYFSLERRIKAFQLQMNKKKEYVNGKAHQHNQAFRNRS